MKYNQQFNREHGLTCPDCGHHDCYSKYEDHTYCFSCGRVKYPKGYFKKEKEKKSSVWLGTLSFPKTYTTTLPPEAIRWLGQRGVAENLALHYHIGYVEDEQISALEPDGYKIHLKKRLIFPIYRGYELLCYQARSIVSDPPKYYTVGAHKAVFKNIEFEDRKTLVIVEDMLSAIRLRPFVPAIALLGTKLQEDTLLGIVKDKHKKKVLVWLDADKPGQKAAEIIAKRLNVYLDTKIINAAEPKLLFDSEIKEVLNGQ